MFKLIDFGIDKENFNIKNGLRITSFYKKNAPIFLSTSFMCGSRNDPKGKEGLAHFMEHLLTSGTKKFPTKDLLAAYVEDLGGTFGASTGIDTVKVWVYLGEPNDLEQGVELMSEILLNSIFDDKTIENERKAILRELEKKKASPSKMLGELERELVFQNTPIGKSILGTTESINNITKEDILNFYKKYIRSDLACITVSGDADKNKLSELLEQKLNLPISENVEKNQEPSVTRVKSTGFIFFDNNSLETSLLFRTAGIKNNDSRALAVLAGILSGGRTGVLKKRLRYELGLVYSVSSGNVSMADYGYFSVSCPISKDSIQSVLNIICDELKRISENGPTNEELNLTKNRLIKSTKIYMQTSEGWVKFHEYRNLYIPEENWTLEDYIESIEKLTAEDISRVAKKYFTNDNWYLAMTGPADEKLADNIDIKL